MRMCNHAYLHASEMATPPERKTSMEKNQPPSIDQPPPVDQPPSRKRRVLLSSKKTVDRFDIVDESKIKEAATGVVPINTKKNTLWACQNFSDWAKVRNTKLPNDPVPFGLLSSSDPALVCKWLCCYVMETRQQSGKPYPPSSIYSLLCGLYRTCRANGVTFNFLDKADTRFRELHNILDSLCSKLHAEGVGAIKRSAAVITMEDENLLWEASVISFESP